MDIKELSRIVQESGIAGAGGAGFPTYAKFDKRAKTILLNCAECEPILKVHRHVLAKYAYEIMSALQMVAETIEAVEAIICVKGSYIKAVEAVKANLDSFDKIKINILPEVYPAGDEVVMIYEATGKVVPPGSIPIEIGVAVFNVETMFNIYKAVKERQPVIYKYVTVAGEVQHPVTVRAAIGTTAEQLVLAAGGTTIEQPVYWAGGPMTGTIINSFDVITKNSNAILVLPNDHLLIKRKKSKISIDMKRAMGTCCQCQMCTDLCPRNLLGHPIEPHLFMRAATSGVTREIAPFINTMFCCNCGLCELYSCPQQLSPRTLIVEYKAGLRKKGIAIPKEVPYEMVNEARDIRRVPKDRLTTRLDLKQYSASAPLVDELVNTNIVKIPLSQHIGVPSVLAVQKGDQVITGQVIGFAPEGKLGIATHATISGVVLDANERFVIIKCETANEWERK